MGNITVTRYAPDTTGWQGYVEPDDKSWIVFVHDDGHPVVFLNRDPETGAVLPASGETEPVPPGVMQTGTTL